VNPLAALSPRRRLLVLGVVALFAVAAVAIGLRACATSAVPPADQARPGTVILVPGYGGSQDALTVLAARLRSTGRTATVLTLPGSGDGDLNGQADALDAAVTRALQTSSSVDLIGYSAGGVVVRLWLARYRNAPATRRVVTLGSPLHGASVAAVGAAVVPDACPTACHQLAPGSALLRQLDATAPPTGSPWLSIWTRTDATVTPPSSAELAGAVNVAVQDICPDSTVQHGQLPTDPLVVALVLRHLGVAPLTAAPPPSACAQLRRTGAVRS
jgi:triacylglycerol lipase